MSGTPGTTRPPNLLIIVTDQLSPRYLGYTGHPLAQTPHIDALAAGGVVFERMYTPQPLCMPARASLFTGLTPRGHGVRMNGISLDPRRPTFVDALRWAGYETHITGKIHLGAYQTPNGVAPVALDPAAYPECRELWTSGRIEQLPLPYFGFAGADFVGGHGHWSFGDYTRWLRREHPSALPLFEDAVSLAPKTAAAELFNRESYKWALPAELHPLHWIADRTLAYLQARGRAVARQQDAAPFCLVCSMQEPHDPLAPPAPYCHRFDPAEVPPPLGAPGERALLPPHFRALYEQDIVTSGNRLQAMRRFGEHYGECAAHYLGLIAMVDDQVGRVLQALEASGLAGDTLVLFVADHGEAMGDHGLLGKGPYHYDSVIRVPCILSWPGHVAARRESAPASLLDLTPTLLELAGVPVPQGLIGDLETRQPAAPGSLGAAPVFAEAPAAPPPWPGRSLVPLLDGRGLPARPVLVEMDEDYLGFKMRTLVSGRYRITSYSSQRYGELFDLQQDPHELRNLWDDDASRMLRASLLQELLQELMRSDISLPRQIGRY